MTQYIAPFFFKLSLKDNSRLNIAKVHMLTLFNPQNKLFFANWDAKRNSKDAMHASNCIFFVIFLSSICPNNLKALCNIFHNYKSCKFPAPVDTSCTC